MYKLAFVTAPASKKYFQVKEFLILFGIKSWLKRTNIVWLTFCPQEVHPARRTLPPGGAGPLFGQRCFTAKGTEGRGGFQRVDQAFQTVFG